MEKKEKSSGNTIPRANQSKYWCFTSFSEDLDKIIHTLEKNKIKYIIGKEICPKTGKEHLQGYIESEKKIRPIESLKLNKEIHWEKRQGNRDQNIKYCSKENNFVTNFENIKIKKRAGMSIEKPLIIVEWMQEVIEYIEGPRNDRNILWIYDYEGRKGKTKFCKYIYENYEACKYFTGGKANDITSQIIEEEINPEICILDLPRNNEGYISYNALEQMKNGMINSSKYKGGTKSFPCPHVIVFANFRPVKKELSEDRWIIHKI